MWKTETWGERQSHLLVQVSVHGHEFMFGKHWMEMGVLGCWGWKQVPDNSWTAALHYRYTWYGNKNKVPVLSKLFLVSLYEKHNFQGFSSHWNSKTDILVFQRLWKKSSPCCTSWSVSAELAVFHLGQQSSINLHKAGSFCFQTDHEESYDLQIRPEDPWLCFRMQILLFLLEILKLNDLVRRPFLPTLVMGLSRDYLDYQVAFSVYQWPQDQFALLENKYNSCLQ